MIEEKEINFEVIPRVPEESIGWLEMKLPKLVMTRLESYIEEAKKKSIDYNFKLAGNISKSLLMNDKDNWFFENVLTSLIDYYDRTYPTLLRSVNILTEAAPFCLNEFWVNFQKENEINPLHDHGGVFSFVVWVKIPTDWREQHALPICANSNQPQASNFEFRYTSLLGDQGHQSYFLDETKEGCMLFFPARLHHQVFPFYNCDKKRISISGNIYFNTHQNNHEFSTKRGILLDKRFVPY